MARETDLGREVKALLAQRERSLTWLAQESGVERRTLARIVAGRTSRPHRSTLAAIAKPLKVQEGYLLDLAGHDGSQESIRDMLARLERKVDGLNRG